MPAKTVLAVVVFLFIGLLSCQYFSQSNVMNSLDTTTARSDTAFLTTPEHLIFVWLENKEPGDIVGNPEAPYLNALIARGTLFTNMKALTHPSFPNYVAFFAGDPNGIYSDSCMAGAPLETANLYTALEEVGKSFAWYSEDLPSRGSTVCSHNYYHKKHNPAALFANVPEKANKSFADFPKDFLQLENVVCISPNLLHDMHDGTIAQADTWLKEQLASLVEWCARHNSIFVVYFDESDTYQSNQIPVIAVGEKVKQNYLLDSSLDHFNWTRTICSMFKAPNAWTPNLKTRQEITGCWKK